jgi:hypothetical protein
MRTFRAYICARAYNLYAVTYMRVLSLLALAMHDSHARWTETPPSVVVAVAVAADVVNDVGDV